MEDSAGVRIGFGEQVRAHRQFPALNLSYLIPPAQIRPSMSSGVGLKGLLSRKFPPSLIVMLPSVKRRLSSWPSRQLTKSLMVSGPAELVSLKLFPTRAEGVAVGLSSEAKRCARAIPCARCDVISMMP